MTEPDPGTYLHDSGDADDVDHYLSIALATGPPLAVSTHLGHLGIGPCRGCRSPDAQPQLFYIEQCPRKRDQRGLWKPRRYRGIGVARLDGVRAQ